MSAARVVFGSDYPHSAGLEEPLSFLDDLAALPRVTVARIMGGNLRALRERAPDV